MPSFYLDTSALMKYYREEIGSEVTKELLEHPGIDDRFATSFLTVLELTSSVLRLAKGGQLPQQLVEEILVSLAEDIHRLFRVWPLDEASAEQAITVILQHRLRTGDALQLATALNLATSAPGAQLVFVSSDKELLSAAVASGFSVLDPESEDAFQDLLRLRE